MDAVERRQGAGRVGEGRAAERVVLLDPEVLDAVQHEVHARDGRRGQVLLLAEDAPEEGPRVAAGPLDMLDRAEQHAAGAAGRVVDALALLRIEQLDHHPHDAPRRVELTRLLAPRDVGELADQVLVGVAQNVGLDRLVAQRHAGEALDEVPEQLVAEHLAVAPVGRAEDPRQGLGIGALDRSHRPRQHRADVARRLADLPPMAGVRQRKAVQLWKDAQVDVAEFFLRLCSFLVPDVADPLEEQQWEDVALPVRPVDGAAAKNLGAPPQLGLQVLQG